MDAPDDDENHLEKLADAFSEHTEGNFGVLTPCLIVMDFEGEERFVIEGDPGEIGSITVKEKTVLEVGDQLFVALKPSTMPPEFRGN